VAERLVSSRRTVLAALVGAGLLAALLLALGILQLAEVSAIGNASSLEAFGIAFLLGLTGVVLPVAVGYLAYRGFDREIAALTASVDAAAEGEGRRAFVARGRGNAGELASALTRLVSGLVDQVDQGRRESRLLESVIGAMKEGMVVLGHDRKIRAANDAFRQLFRTPFEPAGRLLASRGSPSCASAPRWAGGRRSASSIMRRRSSKAARGSRSGVTGSSVRAPRMCFPIAWSHPAAPYRLGSGTSTCEGGTRS
jgi:PAS domain-containing protein